MQLAHVVGFDDAPFDSRHRGDVLLVGAVFSGHRLDGVLSGKVRRDGANSTQTVIHMLKGSRFAPQVHAVLLQGIAFAGFNVIDLYALHAALGIPAVAITRKRPDLDAIKRALLGKVPGGQRKWRLIQRLGAVEAAGGLFMQAVGVESGEAGALIQRLAINGKLPEPLRVAHLIAGGITLGESRHRP